MCLYQESWHHPHQNDQTILIPFIFLSNSSLNQLFKGFRWIEGWSSPGRGWNRIFIKMTIWFLLVRIIHSLSGQKLSYSSEEQLIFEEKMEVIIQKSPNVDTQSITSWLPRNTKNLCIYRRGYQGVLEARLPDNIYFSSRWSFGHNLYDYFVKPLLPAQLRLALFPL